MDPITSSQTFEEDPDLGVTELDDGSAIIDLPEEEEKAETDFYSNLAESIDHFKLNTTASSLLDLIEKDQKAREKRDEQYEEGLRRTGLGDDAPGGASFDGASRIVHPVLAEGCVDFAARAIKELFPANGPVKTKVWGETNEPKLEKAKKKRDFLNFLLTRRITEYRAEKEILFTQLPLGGSQYEKYWFDPTLGRIRMEFVPIDKVLLPFSAASFYNSPRVTHIQEVTRAEFENRVESGFYKDIDNLITDGMPEETGPQEANNKIEGKDADQYNEDGLRLIYEVSCRLDLEGEDDRAPYIIHIDEPTGKIVAVYRNWEEKDEKQEALDWWVEDKFIPWRGAYGIGLPHLIGGMAAALTGALRALLDSAHINNSPGAVKLKGGRTSGANTQIAQTEVKEIDAPAGVDDIRKVMMPLPFNPPSPVLFQLLDWITGQAKGVVATAEERIADAGNNMPVGTTLALIEQGSQVFCSIHSRLHAAQARALEIICRLVRQYPDAHAEDLAKFGLTAEDFVDNDDIQPVSDPQIFSETQRHAQMQAVQQMSAADAMDPSIPWNKIAIRRRSLELLRIDGIDELLPKPPEPVTADPVSENVAAMKGSPLKVAQEQDHEAHIQAHLTFIMNPLNSMDPSPMPQLGAIMQHVREHLTAEYEKLCTTMLPQAVQQYAASGEPHNPDKIAMLASNMAAQQIGQIAQALGPLMQQAGEIVGKKMPQPQVDPAVQKTFEAAMAEIKRKTDYDTATLDMNKSKLASEQQFNQLQQQIDERQAQQEAMLKAHIAQITEDGKAVAEQLRQQVEMMKNDADNKQSQITELLKNRDDNQTAILIERMKQEMSAMMPQQTEAPRQDDGMLKEMQRMLSEIEKAKTGDALTATVEALRTMMEGQRGHQERTMALAQQLLRAE
jgi:hypothetical protein